MLYWLVSHPTFSHIRGELGKKLQTYLELERKNWRKDVFYIDDAYISNSYISTMIENLDREKILLSYIELLHTKECDTILDISNIDYKTLHSYISNVVNKPNIIYIYNSEYPNNEKYESLQPNIKIDVRKKPDVKTIWLSIVHEIY